MTRLEDLVRSYDLINPTETPVETQTEKSVRIMNRETMVKEMPAMLEKLNQKKFISFIGCSCFGDQCGGWDGVSLRCGCGHCYVRWVVTDKLHAIAY